MLLSRRAAPQRAPRESRHARRSTGGPLRCTSPPAPDQRGQLASCAAAALPPVAKKGLRRRWPAASCLRPPPIYPRTHAPSVPCCTGLSLTHRAHAAAACASIQTPLVATCTCSPTGRAADTTPHTRLALTARLSVYAASAVTTLLLGKEGECERALLLPRHLLANIYI